MSQAFLRLHTQSRPRPLVGCNTLQHTLVEMEINDPDGRRILEMTMSTDQFLRLMIGNTHVDCTLTSYPKNRGDFVEEVAPMPQTHREDVRERLAEMEEKDNERMTGIIENLRAMVNGHIKPNKTALDELLKQMEVVCEYRTNNTQYVVQQAEEAVSAIENDLRGGLALMICQMTGSDVGNQIVKTLMSGDDRLRLEGDPDLKSQDGFPEYGNFSVQENKPNQEKVSLIPMPNDLPPLQPPVIDIDDMTPSDLAREINRHLRAFEKDQKQNPINEKYGTRLLYNSGATTGGRGNSQVRIVYVSYQGSTNIDEGLAREYLKALRKGKFITHYELKRKLEDQK